MRLTAFTSTVLFCFSLVPRKHFTHDRMMLLIPPRLAVSGPQGNENLRRFGIVLSEVWRFVFGGAETMNKSAAAGSLFVIAPGSEVRG
jgi:hypothetical protein